jgi:hypothetical protein
MLPTYFHATPVRLAAGNVIEPGNCGRIIRLYKAEGNHLITICRELALEAVRLASHPAKPSRLSCVFACPTRSGLAEFCRTNNRLVDVTYAVEPVDATVSVHLADYRLILSSHLAANVPALESMSANIRSYWDGPATDCYRVLDRRRCAGSAALRPSCCLVERYRFCFDRARCRTIGASDV